jgi:hypothetical protein
VLLKISSALALLFFEQTGLNSEEDHLRTTLQFAIFIVFGIGMRKAIIFLVPVLLALHDYLAPHASTALLTVNPALLASAS